jgi:hypothetical protein
VNTMQPLHLGAFQQFKENAVYLDRAVYAVVDDLIAWHELNITCLLYIPADEPGSAEAAANLLAIDAHAVGGNDDEVAADGRHVAVGVTRH